MIVTVTLNPILERRYSFKCINYPGVNREGIMKVRAGGKGINVSRQLNQLNTSSLVFTFLGGNNGKQFREVLKEENINFTSVKLNSETREGVIITDEKNEKVTYLFGANPEVTENEAEEYKEKLEKIIQNCEIVIFSGSSPCKNTDSIIPFGIDAANKYDKISICDTYGEQLSSCIKAGPTILHNNIDELQKSLGIKLNSEENILAFLDNLYKSGIKQSYITDAEKIFYSSNFDFHFKVKPPAVKSVDSTGSGDSFVAGIIYGWHNGLTFEEGLKFATRLGAVNASRFDVSSIMLKEADDLMLGVDVIPIGKKMKILDARPR
jgi:1-phosphofructokinase family hexose kinase